MVMTNEELLSFKRLLEDMKASINAGVDRTLDTLNAPDGNIPDPSKIGRASCRERV